MHIQPEWYAGALGFIMPIIVNWVIKMHWTRRRKSVVAIITSIIAGFFSAWLSGNFTPDGILKDIALIFTISQVVYDQFWKDVLNKSKK